MSIFFLPFGFIFYFKTADTFAADFYLTLNNKNIEKSLFQVLLYQTENLRSGASDLHTDTADKPLHQQTSCLKCSFTPFLQGSSEYNGQILLQVPYMILISVKL